MHKVDHCELHKFFDATLFRSDRNRWVRTSREEESNMIPWEEDIIIYNFVSQIITITIFLRRRPYFLFQISNGVVTNNNHHIFQSTRRLSSSRRWRCWCRRGSWRTRRLAPTPSPWSAWTSTTGQSRPARISLLPADIQGMGGTEPTIQVGPSLTATMIQATPPASSLTTNQKCNFWHQILS